jgi:hypothetical protein
MVLRPGERILEMRSRSLWLVLAVCVAVAFAAVWYPMYVIRPFRAQGARELAAALWVRQWGPWIATVAAVGGAAIAWRIWERSRGWGRAGAAACAVLGVAFAALAYVNVFELMFHRIATPGAIAAASAKVDADDMVLAVNAGGQARAYPVRAMAYHHIANDWVGGEPIAATY